MRPRRFGLALLAAALSGCSTASTPPQPSRATQPRPSLAVSPEGGACSADHLRNTRRAILCGQVVDARTGTGVPGGNVRFVRAVGGEMNGRLDPDGTFSINVPAGFGRLTIYWSCRRSVRWVDTLTIPAGTGMERTFTVSVVPADTLCRRESRDLSDTTLASVALWMSRGPCFAIDWGPWKPRLGAAHRPPRHVRLDSAREQRSGQRTDHPLHYTPAAGWRAGGWGPLQGDSVELYWRKEWTSVSLTLGMGADSSSLTGRGMWMDDIVMTDSLGFLDRRRYPNGPASARRVPCETVD